MITRLLGFASKRLGHNGPVGSGTVPPEAERAIRSCHELLSDRGEVSGVGLAKKVLSAYQALDPSATGAFFDQLIHQFSPNPQKVAQLGVAFGSEPSPENLARVQRAVEPLRQDLFRRLNMAPGGTSALVAMRHRLLRALRDNPHWSPIEADLAHLLASWFNRGFLLLQRIDWRTPAIVLEKLIQHEAVHAINGWPDLRRRLDSDRRCFAFFHPALLDEPLIFIEVALTRGMCERIQPLLDPKSPVDDPRLCDSATFYSITNCQEGLRGISFGNLLIKQVVEDLQREFKWLRTFATLSPIPGFRRWLTSIAEDSRAGNQPLAQFATELLNFEGTSQDPRTRVSVRRQREIRCLCAYYLMHVKLGREPMDPVARFHLKNGARLERLNWLADTSAQGLERSSGMMVNYLYRLSELERNHELYSCDRKVIASRHIQRLAREHAVSEIRPSSELY